MKKLIVIFFLSLSLAPTQVNAQYWDWVTDEKSAEAFISNYSEQLIKLYTWLASQKIIQMAQDTIAAKATFIHMVRDSLFKSLMDVSLIDDGRDEQLIREVFSEINTYYYDIQRLCNRHEDFRPTWENYSKFVSDHARDMLAMADMATDGKNEKNLLDKNQRLYLLAYVLKELRGLKATSIDTHQMLTFANNYIDAQRNLGN
jgi:hypothetical protein